MVATKKTMLCVSRYQIFSTTNKFWHFATGRVHKEGFKRYLTYQNWKSDLIIANSDFIRCTSQNIKQEIFLRFFAERNNRSYISDFTSKTDMLIYISIVICKRSLNTNVCFWFVEAVTNAFLNVLPNSQVNTSVRVCFLRDSGTGVFLWFL